MAAAAFFASCEPKNELQTMSVYVTKGAIVLNSGNTRNSVDGSITFIDFTTELAEQSVFREANGISLGGSLNDLIVHEGKIYVTGGEENTIFVLEPKTFRLIARISTTDGLGESEGECPNRLCAYADKVYFSTRGGYVGVIDTFSLSIEKKYQVGPYPEGLAVRPVGETLLLYVANSDEGFGCGSISVIDLSTGSSSDWMNDKIRYPLELLVVNDQIYVLNGGFLDENMVQKGTGFYLADNSGANKLAPDALLVSTIGYRLLYYRKSEAGDTGYSVLDIRSNSVLGFNFKGDDLNPIAEPGAMAIDPNTSNIMLASSPEGDDDIDPCHVNLYTGDGQFLKSFPAGVCPKRIVFLYGSPNG